MPDGPWCRTALLVANPVAGDHKPDFVDTVARYCADFVTQLSTVRTEYPGHAHDLAAGASADGVDVIIALGGDGTAREIAAGLAERAAAPAGGHPADRAAHGPAVLHLPAGTGNSLYRELWGDRPWRDAVRPALGADERRVRRLDMARIRETDTLVLLGACSGLVAEALVTAAGLTEVHGRDRYEDAVAHTLRDFTPHPSRITVDGVPLHDGPTVLANVGGGRYRGGRFKLLPRSVLDDGLLDVCVVGGGVDPRRLPALTRDGDHLDHPAVRYARGRRIVIDRTDGRPLTFEHDGEVCAGTATRYTVQVVPNIVPVLAPPAPG